MTTATTTTTPSDDRKWLFMGYVALTAFIAFVVYKTIETIGIHTAWADQYDWYATMQMLVGILVGVGSVLYLRRDHERQEYLLSSIAEVRKVTFPTGADTKRMTLIVVVVVGVFGVILSLFDLSLAWLMRQILT